MTNNQTVKVAGLVLDIGALEKMLGQASREESKPDRVVNAFIYINGDEQGPFEMLESKAREACAAVNKKAVLPILPYDHPNITLEGTKGFLYLPLMDVKFIHFVYKNDPATATEPPKAPEFQTLDMSAVCSEFGDLLIKNGIKGGFKISLDLHDVPFVYYADGNALPAFTVGYDYPANVVSGRKAGNTSEAPHCSASGILVQHNGGETGTEKDPFN